MHTAGRGAADASYYSAEQLRALRREARVRPQQTTPEGDAVSNVEDQASQTAEQLPRAAYRLTRAELRFFRARPEKRGEVAAEPFDGMEGGDPEKPTVPRRIEKENDSMKKILIALILMLCILAGTMGSALAGVLIVSSTTADDDSEALYQNIDRAIAALNGGVVEKGKPFSFNEVVGPRTAENGYTSAPNGNGVSVMGGGVSQVATTLHLALENMGEDIIYEELHTFGSAFRAGYVETAAESVLTDYARDLDYRFTSKHDENLSISMWCSDGMVFCQLTGIGAETETPASNPNATSAPEVDSTATKQMRVANVNSYVNLRAVASTQSESLMQIPKDAVVKYIGEQDGDFLKISYEGKTGYVHGKYLEETTDMPVMLTVVNCKQSVTLRTEPSRNASSLADIPLGAQVKDVGITEGEFRKVVYQGREGYVLAAYLSD